MPVTPGKPGEIPALNMTTKTKWQASDTTDADAIGEIEFQDNTGEWHNFNVLGISDRLIFGSYCNAGFLESGFILTDEIESLDDTLRELLADLECYYNDGPSYVSRIICNDRM